MTLTLGSSGLILPPHQARLLITNLALLQLVGHQTLGVSISCELAMVSQLVSQLVSQFSLELTRDGEAYHSARDDQDMPALLRASYAVCRVLCVLCLCLWPLCDPSSRSPGSNPLSDATRGATSPILPSRQAIQACQAIFSIPGGSLAQHRPDRPDGILVASRLSPRRTQSKIRALLCSLGRLLLHSITACVATDT